jgi:putative multiple sugar transport system substrate-binding protein
MDNILGAYYTDTKLDSVLAAADCLSIGVISSLDSFGYGKSPDLPFPVVTGQDCELTAIKSIMSDQQYMSVFLDPVVLAGKTLGIVDAMEAGTEIKPDRTFNNDAFEVPTVLYDPVMIDKSNYELLIDRGFYTKEDLDL